MNTTTSISRYIGIHVISLMALLVFVYSITIEKVYQWGVYDTTHYFLSIEADRLLESSDKPFFKPSTQHNINYYNDKLMLPSEYRELLNDKKHMDGEMLVHQSGSIYFYLLPALNPNTGKFFYMTSIYDADDDPYEVILDIPELQIILALSVIVLVLFLLKRLTWPVIQAIQKIESWANQISSESNGKQNLSPITLRFSELNSVANNLHDAVTAIKKKNLQEKHFLKALSHELRTPLATTKMAVDLLQKKVLSDEVALKIARIQRANNNMLATSDCLLWLWSKRKTNTQQSHVDLLYIINDTLSSNQYLMKNKSIEIVVDIIPDSIIYVETSLLSILFSNLIRNALQYTQSGIIKITASAEKFSITNSDSNSTNEHHYNDFDEGTYGYGIGLYLVKTICIQKNWLIKVDNNQSDFSVLVQFDNKN